MDESSQESNKLVIDNKNDSENENENENGNFINDTKNDQVSENFPTEEELAGINDDLAIFTALEIPAPSRSLDNISDLVYLGRKRTFRKYSGEKEIIHNDFSEGFKTRLAKIKLLAQTDIRWNLAGRTVYCAVDCSRIDKEQMVEFTSKLFELHYTDKTVGCITFSRNWAVFTASTKKS